MELVTIAALGASLLAADATASIHDDGVVEGLVTVSVAARAVRDKLDIVGWVAETTGSSTKATLVKRDGACKVLDMRSEHPIASVDYRVTECPTADGFRADLVESSSFTKYWTEWSVTDRPEGGATIRYRIDLDSTMAVPNALVRRITRKNVVAMLTKIAEALGE